MPARDFRFRIRIDCAGVTFVPGRGGGDGMGSISPVQLETMPSQTPRLSLSDVGGLPFLRKGIYVYILM